MNKIVMITGATSGIGEACAHKFAAEKYAVIISGRRGERLQTLASRLRQDYGVEVLPLLMDLRDRNEVKKAITGLPKAWQEIDVLVNNAGLALGLTAFPEGDEDDWETMIDTNVKGLLYMSKAVAPGMIARGRGHIINIGSIAGREVYFKGNVYCATKHAVGALSKAMRMEMLPHGIRVTLVAPGAVETEFSLVRFKGDSERARRVYKGYVPLHPADVAEVVYFATTLPPTANIDDVLVMPTAQAGASTFHKKP
jgi:3-hydroxy acid dehydrogenase / malonic semialdehyde reductase